MPTVLTGQEEARVALAGVKSSITCMPESLIVLDIGGGSTELVCVNKNDNYKNRKYPPGSYHID